MSQTTTPTIAALRRECRIVAPRVWYAAARVSVVYPKNADRLGDGTIANQVLFTAWHIPHSYRAHARALVIARLVADRLGLDGADVDRADDRLCGERRRDGIAGAMQLLREVIDIITP